MSQSAAARLGPGPLGTVLDAVPDGVAVFDGEWTIRYINPAAATLWRRNAAELLDRNIWVALPELGGTILHSFLRHARAVGTQVTWRGFYPPAGRWLQATATVVDDMLQLYFRPTDLPASDPPSPGAESERAEASAAAAGDGSPATVAEALPREEDADRLRFLAEVSEALIATLDTGESAGKLVELVVPRLGDGAIVTVVGDDGQSRQESHHHRDPARGADLDAYLAGRVRGTGDDTPMVEALLSGEPVQLTTIDEAMIAPSLPSEAVRAAWRGLNATSFTIVPLRARGETFGVLTLLNCGNRPPLTEMEIATAVEAARRGALALDNTRLYGRQLKVAETLQRSLLSPPVKSDRLEIAVRYRPAAAHQQVCGDWYDSFISPDGATMLVIGDVVGHDVTAAAAMGQIRSILRGLACDRPGSPAQTLTRVDRVLTALQVDTLATALVARIEQTPEQTADSRRTIRWSSAGHIPPLLLRGDGTVHVLETPPERLLGADPDSPRSNHDIEVGPGDTVVFCTDGLVEHGRRTLDDGLDRLTSVLAELGGAGTDELCDDLLARIVTGRADDDIAILAVRFDGVRPNGLSSRHNRTSSASQ